MVPVGESDNSSASVPWLEPSSLFSVTSSALCFNEDKHSDRDVDNILPIKLTYVTLWDVAQLPSFVLVSGVAPDAFVCVRISAEIVVAYVRESVFVRLLFRPLLTLLSGYCLCDASLIILPSFAVFAHTLASW